MKKTLIAILCTVLVIVVAVVLIKKDSPAVNDDATTSSVSQQQTAKDDSPAEAEKIEETKPEITDEYLNAILGDNENYRVYLDEAEEGGDDK